jgi:hypothetical protein
VRKLRLRELKQKDIEQCLNWDSNPSFSDKKGEEKGTHFGQGENPDRKRTLEQIYLQSGSV